MGMSTHIYGFKPPDEEWTAKRQAFEACQAAGVDPPKELWEFFGWEEPDPAGVSVDIDEAVRPYQTESEDGFEVSLDALPSGIKVIRFVNSY